LIEVPKVGFTGREWLAFIPIDTGLWKSPSQKLAQGLGELKAYINPTSTPHMDDVGLKSHTLQLGP